MKRFSEKVAITASVAALSFSAVVGVPHAAQAEGDTDSHINAESPAIPNESNTLSSHETSSESAAPETRSMPAASERAADVPASAPARSTVIWVDGTNGDDSSTGLAQDQAVRTVQHALARAQEEGITNISVRGNFSSTLNFAGPYHVTVAEDTTVTGQGNASGDAIVLSQGAHLETAQGATLTVDNFRTAFSIDQTSTLSDGTYEVSRATLFDLKGSIAGSQADAVRITLNDAKTIGKVYGSAQSITYANITLENSEVLVVTYGSVSGAVLTLDRSTLTTHNARLALPSLKATSSMININYDEGLYTNSSLGNAHLTDTRITVDTHGDDPDKAKIQIGGGVLDRVTYDNQAQLVLKGVETRDSDLTVRNGKLNVGETSRVENSRLRAVGADANDGVYVSNGTTISDTQITTSDALVRVSSQSAITNGSITTTNGSIEINDSTVTGNATEVTDGTYRVARSAFDQNTVTLHSNSDKSGTLHVIDSTVAHMAIAADGDAIKYSRFYGSQISDSTITLDKYETEVLNSQLSNTSMTGSTNGEFRSNTAFFIGGSTISNNSTVTADGDRIIIRNGTGSEAADKITTLDSGSTITVRNSPRSTSATSGGGIGLRGDDITLRVQDAHLVLESPRESGLGHHLPFLTTFPQNGSNQKIEFTGNSTFTSPVPEDTWSGMGATKSGDAFVVLGGSYNMYYNERLEVPFFGAVDLAPTNGADHGNERLSFFTMSDAHSSDTELHPIGTNGAAYTYPVGNDDGTGKKHVWLPAAHVTFDLQGVGVYADGSSDPKQALVPRGYSSEDVDSVASGEVSAPEDPIAPGKRFIGWVYEGTTTAYDPTAPVTQDTTLVPQWEDAETYGITYKINLPGNESRKLVMAEDGSHTVDLPRADEIFEYNRDAYKFIGWRLDSDPSRLYQPGESYEIPANAGSQGGNAVATAQWEEIRVAVKFHANHGTFTDTSVFKQHPAIFTIEKDDWGGDVAVLNKQPVAADSETIDAIINELEPGQSLASLGLTSNSWLKDSNDNWTVTYGPFRKPAQKEFYGFAYDTKWTATPHVENARDSELVNISGSNVVNKNTDYYLNWTYSEGGDGRDIPQYASPNTRINSDLWINGSSNTSDIVMIEPGQAFSMTGSIDMTEVKKQLDLINHTEVLSNWAATPKLVTYPDADSVFYADLELPEGIKLDRVTKEDITFDGLGTLFNVQDIEIRDHSIHITYRLKQDGGVDDEGNPKERAIDSYDALTKAIYSVREEVNDNNRESLIPHDNLMSVTVNGLYVDENAPDQAEYTAKGRVSGEFTSFAQNPNRVTKHFSFSWYSDQVDKDGRGVDPRDPRSDDDRSVYATVRVVRPQETTPLQADLLINTTTEADAPYRLHPNESFATTLTVDTHTITQQVDDITSHHPGEDPDNVALNLTKNTYKATIAFPEMIKVPDDATFELVGGNGVFTMDNTVRRGNTLEVELTFAKTPTTLGELIKMLKEAEKAPLGLKVNGLSLVPTSPEGTYFTTQATFVGRFEGSTKSSGTGSGQVVYGFNYTWNASQVPEGKDAVARDTSTIQMTVYKLQISPGPNPGPTPNPQPGPYPGPGPQPGPHPQPGPEPGPHPGPTPNPPGPIIGPHHDTPIVVDDSTKKVTTKTADEAPLGAMTGLALLFGTAASAIGISLRRRKQ